MSFDVHWTPTAENELAALWLDPALRAPVTAAAQRIDERLERNAADEGESRPGDYRITFEPPLGVLFPSPSRPAASRWFTCGRSRRDGRARRPALQYPGTVTGR